MGRLNKKLQTTAAKRQTTANKSVSISKSDVLRTLARKDKSDTEKRDNVPKLTESKKAALPKTLDELDTHPDFQLLLLDKKTALSELARNSQTSEIGHTLHNGEERSIQTKIKKKDKMKMRKELLQKKIHVIKLLKDEEKAKKKRKRTTITGDMKPMADTLKAVMTEEIATWDTKGKTEESRVKKKNGPMKQKKVKSTFLEGISVFNQVNSHKQYVNDPFGTISTHIENKMLIEAMKTE